LKAKKKRPAAPNFGVLLDAFVFRIFCRTALCGADKFVAQDAFGCQTNTSKYLWRKPCGIGSHRAPTVIVASRLNQSLEHFSEKATQYAGSSWAFAIAAAVIVVWLLTGPVFHFSDTWQLIINTGTTIVTFLMVFLIQRTQNKETTALQLKLNELVAAVKGASNRLIDLEDWTEEELKNLHEHYQRLAELAREEKDTGRSLSVDSAVERHRLKHGRSDKPAA
jgi:low affinity Fe/Cu permease